MKVKVVGNGISWVSRPNSSFVVNDEMLVDTPQGSTKFMLEEVDFSKIKYILITHFHSDHFMGLHLIYEFVKNRRISHRVKVIAPKTAYRRLRQMFKLTENDHPKSEIFSFFEFFELKPNMNLKVGDYSIQTFKTKHNVKYCLGYVLSYKNGTPVGFTGDTAYCNGLIELIESSEVIFLDTSSKDIGDRHLSAGEVIALKKKYNDKKFYSVHVSEPVLNGYKNRLDIPDVGEVIHI